MGYASIRDMHERLAVFVGDIDRESPKGRKRRRILEAATELFLTYGYRKTNIDEIAKAAGIAKGTVYLYFTNKSEVLLAAVAYEKLRSLSLLEGVFDTNIPARTRLRLWVRASLRMVANSPLLARLGDGDQELRAALMDVDPKLVATSNAEYVEFMGHLLDEAVHPRRWTAEDRHQRMVAITAFSYFARMIRSDLVRMDMSIDQFTDVLASIIVDGMNPPDSDNTQPDENRS
jgi:AcrR family transcriptional regulator